MSIGSGLCIEYLADRADLVDALAAFHFREWGFLRPSETLSERTQRLRLCCGRGGLPTAVVATVEGLLCGSAMLVANDMDLPAERTPWLAGVYVVPQRRRCGLGAALIHRIEQEASAAGFSTLYLYTPSTAAMYARLGWALLERREYLGADVSVMSKQLVG